MSLYTQLTAPHLSRATVDYRLHPNAEFFSLPLYIPLKVKQRGAALANMPEIYDWPRWKCGHLKCAADSVANLQW